MEVTHNLKHYPSDGVGWMTGENFDICVPIKYAVVTGQGEMKTD